MNQQVGGQAPSFALLRRSRRENLEEAVKQLNTSKGVYGVLVTTENWKIISSTFHHTMAAYWKRHMKIVEVLGFGAVRTDPTNELQFIRVQSKKFEILLSIAKDHRVLVVFSSNTKDPLKPSLQSVKDMKRDKMEQKKLGKSTRPTMDYSRPHVEIVGGKETVIITEKIGDKEFDQQDRVNYQR